MIAADVYTINGLLVPVTYNLILTLVCQYEDVVVVTPSVGRDVDGVESSMEHIVVAEILCRTLFDDTIVKFRIILSWSTLCVISSNSLEHISLHTLQEVVTINGRNFIKEYRKVSVVYTGIHAVVVSISIISRSKALIPFNTPVSFCHFSFIGIFRLDGIVIIISMLSSTDIICFYTTVLGNLGIEKFTIGTYTIGICG